MLQFNTVYAILENNGCLPVSYEGLIKDYPIEHHELEEGYLEFQAYETLAIMTPEQLQQINDEFAFFIQNGIRPIILERKSNFSKAECLKLSQFSEISFSVFEELVHKY